ncbi:MULTISPECIES: L,D-transpeptidase family protein [unclassified Paenibacillus]|uniref:L,D-transpeptidase family protein n=1 Tax=unclassified Paenibacillus TaxID=185978 RepID=UPI001AE7C762|nr:MULTISPECIES: L,D-transpeptidase family protein [unclassified Paenibacillus]MBP1156771.1 hypothetical protein [Paenibacillus sp. PvP091]MBP1172490.1 hypothetical protein [Paenibacillus sp. PvR098]MBP2438871.1 hypothetical protein [Paenibacillus sp. PvP052]
MQHFHDRFKPPAADNLVHLHKNVYVNRKDPNYHEKVLRYLDPHSPEAHYRLGQQFEHRGEPAKAIFHYKAAMKTQPSPYYYPASAAIRRLDKTQHSAVSAHRLEAGPFSSNRRTRSAIPLFMKTLLIALLLLNLLLFAALYGPTTVSKAVSVVLPWSIGKEVTYESVETPFVMHFPYGHPREQVEKALHIKAMNLSETYPMISIRIYGMASPVTVIENKAMPLTNEESKSKAFVVAEYNPAIDTAVKIRFLNSKLQQLHTAAGANLVRTALLAYVADHGNPPASIDLLLKDYPNNYLSFLPIETESGSANVRTVFDRSGGWVYDTSADEPSSMFYPNTAADTAAYPYVPLTLTVNPSSHSLRLAAGPLLLAEAPVGLGRNNLTPAGRFFISERVLEPQGSKPGVYGAAALGMGGLAIHGTLDEESIRQNQSLGCIRLSNSDIAALYPLVPKGTEVEIAKATAPKGDFTTALSPELLLPAQPLFPSPDETAPYRLFHWLG